jgi:hypothetical protein
MIGLQINNYLAHDNYLTENAKNQVRLIALACGLRALPRPHCVSLACLALPQNAALSNLKTVHTNLGPELPKTFKDCVQWARNQFEVRPFRACLVAFAGLAATAVFRLCSVSFNLRAAVAAVLPSLTNHQTLSNARRATTELFLCFLVYHSAVHRTSTTTRSSSC